MDLRMQRLHAPVHDLGKARMRGDLLDADPVLLQQGRRPSGGQDLDLSSRKRPREVDDAFLVGDADERATQGDHWALSPYTRSFLRSVPRVMPRMSAARL